MKIEFTEHALILSELGEFLAGLLNRITFCSDPADSPKIADRLYPDPSKDEEEFNEEWREYIQPDLQHLFQTANEVVNGDLALIEQTSKGENPEFSLTIPLSHGEQWLCSLNQARMALAAEFDLTEKDLERDIPRVLSTERELAILQVDLYATLQEYLIGLMDRQ